MKVRLPVGLFLLLGLSHSFGLYQSADPDQSQSEQLAKAGVDMSKPQEIAFTFHFADVHDETKACVSIYEKKFDVESLDRKRPMKSGLA
jgi:hypothetical protein